MIAEQREAAAGRRVAVATVCTANYWPYTAAFIESVTRNCPHWQVHVLCLDELPHGGSFPGVTFVQASEVWGDETASMPLRFNRFEWATASKPVLMRHLLDQGFAEVVFADSDMEFFAPPRALDEAGWSILLQPNVSGLHECESAAWERLHLMYGVYNGGFVAVRDSADARAFVDWWAARSTRYSCTDPTLDVFSDQRWLDLVPGLFGGVRIDRDPACNVAVWNVLGRGLAADGETYRVEGRPLSFFHYHRVRLGLDVEAYLAEVQGHPVVGRLVRNFLARAQAHADAAGPADARRDAPALVHKAVRDAQAAGVELLPGADLRRMAFTEPQTRARLRLAAYHLPHARRLIDGEADVRHYLGSRWYRAQVDLWFRLKASRAVSLRREWTVQSAALLATGKLLAGCWRSLRRLVR